MLRSMRMCMYIIYYISSHLFSNLHHIPYFGRANVYKHVHCRHCNIWAQWVTVCLYAMQRAVMHSHTSLCTLATSTHKAALSAHRGWVVRRKIRVRKLSFFCCLPGRSFTWQWFLGAAWNKYPYLWQLPSLSVSLASGLIYNTHNVVKLTSLTAQKPHNGSLLH